ncbi:MAG: O-antigen ligase family protein [Anaerolineae bacterium]
MKLNRQHVLFIAALAALLGALVAALATTQQRDFVLRGVVDPTRNADLPYRVPLLGVNAELTQYTPEALEEHLALMAEAQVHWVRQFVPWDAIEPERGVYEWQIWDAIMAAMEAYPELELVPVLVNSPAWARDASTMLTAPPDDISSFADFALAFAIRYNAQIDYYQIWDEPNLQSGWGGLSPNLTHYAALLQSAYTAIHSVDAQATVIAAALAPTTETGPQNISDLIYLDTLYTLGAADFADAFAAKPYGFNLPPDDRRVSADVLNFSRLVALREVMVAHGDGQKALWASHWGWNSLPADWAGSESIWGEVSANEQVDFTHSALERARLEWPWIGGMILHHWQPDVSADDPQWGFAVINPQGQPTVLWQALAERPTPTAATVGLYPTRNPYTAYSGVWTFSAFGADMGWVQDSRFSFAFEGTDAALLVRNGDYVAYLYPKLDNANVNALPRDAAGQPYLALRSGDGTTHTSLVPVVRNLPYGTHTLHVIADELIPDEAANRWPLVALAVGRGDDVRLGYDRQIALAWLTWGVALTAVIIAGRDIHWNRLFAPLMRLWDVLGHIGQLLLSTASSVALMLSMFLTWGDGIPTAFRRDSVQLGLSLLTSGLIYINPGLLLTILTALLLFVIIFNRIELGLMLVLVWSPFFLFPVELYQFAFPVAEIILLLTFGAWLLRILARIRTQGIPHLHIQPLDWAVMAWVALGLFSLTWAARPDPAITEFRTLIVQPALFYLILRTRATDKRRLTLLADGLLAGGLLVALIGLVMFVRGDAIITAEEGARRLASVYGSPNNVGLFLGRCIPFALAFVLLKVDQRRRVAMVGVMSLLILTVILSQSAGALFIGVPAAVVMVMLLALRQKALLPLAVLLVIGLIGLFIALQTPRFSRGFSLSEGTNFYRVRVWQSALNVIEDHPVTGLGLDQFLYAFRDTYMLPDAWEEPDLSHPHNLVLDFWVRLGIWGVSLLLLLMFIFWQRAWRRYQALFGFGSSDVLSLALIVGAMGSMANMLMHGMVDNSVFVLDLAYVFMFLLGVIAAQTNTRAIDASS